MNQPGLFSAEEKRAVAYCDGASRGNPGPGGWGAALLTPEGKIIETGCGPLPGTTNNVAEYTGAIEAVRLALKNGVTHLELRADSELLVKQVNGEYRVKAPHLQPLFQALRGELARLVRWRAVHVPRAQNSLADKLSNDGADQAERLRFAPRDSGA